MDLILHSTLTNMQQQGLTLSPRVENTFQLVDAKLFHKTAFLIEEVQSRYPVDFEVRIQEPEKVTIEVLVKATYEMKLRSEPLRQPA
jgi:hypothetical protein